MNGEGTGVWSSVGASGLAAAIAARMKVLTLPWRTVQAPIDKACGEGLMPGTLRALRELGVAIRPGDGQVFRGIRFVTPRPRSKLTFRLQVVWNASNHPPSEDGGASGRVRSYSALEYARHGLSVKALSLVKRSRRQSGLSEPMESTLA